ncbi:MAG: hypothetical protein ACU0BK_11210 [Shimia sp.]|uniref:hypothetical protein n=1 Tax=Shimia sp. TaxID=1954381 RepID=UPI0040590162
MQRKFGFLKSVVLLLCALAAGAVAARGWISYGTDTTALTKPDHESPSLKVALRKYPIPRQFVTKGPAPVGKLYPDPHFRVTGFQETRLDGELLAVQTLKINQAFEVELEREIVSLKLGSQERTFDLDPLRVDLSLVR